jgi:hypothetical protein
MKKKTCHGRKSNTQFFKVVTTDGTCFDII